MTLRENINDIFNGMILLVWYILEFVVITAVFGIPLLLLVEWCFPDYIHIFNEEITTKSIKELIEEKKFNEAIWLIEKKEKSIDGFNEVDFYNIKGDETEAQMAVGNFRAAEKCIEQIDSIVCKRQELGELGEDMSKMHDMLKARLFFRMNAHEKVQEICEEYYNNPTSVSSK